MKLNETYGYGQFINIESNHRGYEEEYYNIHNGQLEPKLTNPDKEAKYNLTIYIHAIGSLALCIILIKMYFN